MRIHQTLWCVLLACVMGCAGTPKQNPPLVRKHLDQPTRMAGYMCAEGTAYFFPDGALRECAVVSDTNFGVARVPAGSWINLDQKGKPDFVFLNHNTRILDYMCRGGSWPLGPTEGPMTGFYPNGALKLCWLAADQNIQGVPCRKASMLFGYSGVDFYDSGKLKACTLSKNWRGHRKGERYVAS